MSQKKVSGRKRHIVVDTTGLLLDAASIQDRDGARLVLARLLNRFPSRSSGLTRMPAS